MRPTLDTAATGQAPIMRDRARRRAAKGALRCVLEIVVFVIVVALLWSIVPAHAQTHRFDCEQRSGIDRARCEGHELMYTRCGPLRGEAHFACDREFLLANPLDCRALEGEDTKRCAAEVAAFATCEPQQGRDFMRCVREQARASPMGSHRAGPRWTPQGESR